MSYQKLVFSNAELMVFRDAINGDRTVSKLVEKFDNAIWSECGICNRFHYTISFEKSEFYVMKDLMAYRDDAVGQVWLEVVVCNSIKYHNYRPVEELSPKK